MRVAATIPRVWKTTLCGPPVLSASYARRYASTARTRRWSSVLAGNPSFVKMLVLLDRAERHEQALRDRLVRTALGHQLENLALARRQLVERVVSALPPDQLAHDGGVEGRTAVRDPSDGRAELLEVGDAILQQIPDPLGARLEQRHRIAGLDVLREEEDADPGMRVADLLRRPQPLVGVRRRHPDVDDRDIGLVHGDMP